MDLWTYPHQSIPIFKPWQELQIKVIVYIFEKVYVMDPNEFVLKMFRFITILEMKFKDSKYCPLNEVNSSINSIMTTPKSTHIEKPIINCEVLMHLTYSWKHKPILRMKGDTKKYCPFKEANSWINSILITPKGTHL